VGRRYVAAGEVTALQHELRDDAVEVGALVVEGLAGAAGALLARAESAEVLGRLESGGSAKPVKGRLGWRGTYLGHLVGEELHDNSASGRAANGDVKEDTGVRHGDGGGGLRQGAVMVVVEECC